MVLIGKEGTPVPRGTDVVIDEWVTLIVESVDAICVTVWGPREEGDD